MKIRIVFLFLLVCGKILAQDSLPNFNASVIAKNKAVIGWKNPFGIDCKQISVQRSYDSLRFFKTIFSSLSPELPENGYVDNDYLSGLKNYYRIFYVLEDGSYFFTKSFNPKISKSNLDESKLEVKLKAAELEKKDKIKTLKSNALTRIEKQLKKEAERLNKIALDSLQKHLEDSIIKQIEDSIASIPKIKYYSIYKRKQKKIFLFLEESEYAKFKDSVATKTKDTLVEKENEIVYLNSYIPPAWKPSTLVFTNNKGYVELAFKDYKNKKYKVVFYDKSNKKLFEIKNVNSEILTLDKGNFLIAGWYFFEAFENDKLIEKNKFLLEADF